MVSDLGSGVPRTISGGEARPRNSNCIAAAIIPRPQPAWLILPTLKQIGGTRTSRRIITLTKHGQDMDEPASPAPSREPEITPEMLRAGIDVLAELEGEVSRAFVVTEVY